MKKIYRGSASAYVLALLGILILAGALLMRSGAPAKPAADVSCNGCNVIVIGVDTLRADHVHAFGYPLPTTPNIDRLVARGYAFTNAISASNWTVPSFMSIMTGVYPSVHKVVNKYSVFTAQTQTLSSLQTLSPQIRTLAQALKSAGYATGGFTGDAGVSGSFGFKQGFDEYTDEKTFGGLANSETHALSWLDGLQKGQKFFMFFHGYDLHGQFNLPQDERTFVPADYKGPYTGSPVEQAKLREDQLSAPLSLTPADVAFWKGLYDSKIHAADAQIGEFLSELDKRGLLKNTIVIVLADHGEEYYEHGGIDHGQSLYDELIHVPIIIDLPQAAGGVAVSAQVSSMDVAPTILQMLNVASDPAYAAQLEGQSLVPYLSGEKTVGRDVFIESDYRDFLHERGVRTADGWMYIRNFVNGKEELYDLNADPGEKNNLAASASAKAAALKQELFAHIQNDLHADPSARYEVGCLPVYPTECK